MKTYTIAKNKIKENHIKKYLAALVVLGFVGFLLTRPIDAKVKATDYGAVCDGITDDTVSIQAALNDAEVVNLPSGTCLIGDNTGNGGAVALDFNSGNTLQGEGNSTVLKTKDGGEAHMLVLNGESNVTIRNLKIDGNSSHNSTGHAIRGEDNYNIRIENVEIINSTGYCIGFEDGTNQNIWITNVKMDGCAQDGIDFKNPDNANTGIFIDNVVIRNFGLVGNQVAGIDIRGVVSINNVQIFNVDAYDTGIRFREDGVASVGAGGHLSQLSNFYIESNTTGDYGVYIPANKVTVSNGNIVGVFNVGVLIPGSYNTVSNVVTTNALYGFRIDEAGRYNTFSGCVARTGTVGFHIKGDYSILNSSVAVNFSRTGIEITSTSDGAVINGNLFRSNGGASIKGGTNTVATGNYGY